MIAAPGTRRRRVISGAAISPAGLRIPVVPPRAPTDPDRPFPAPVADDGDDRDDGSSTECETYHFPGGR